MQLIELLARKALVTVVGETDPEHVRKVGQRVPPDRVEVLPAVVVRVRAFRRQLDRAIPGLQRLLRPVQLVERDSAFEMGLGTARIDLEGTVESDTRSLW